MQEFISMATGLLKTYVLAVSWFADFRDGDLYLLQRRNSKFKVIH